VRKTTSRKATQPGSCIVRTGCVRLSKPAIWLAAREIACPRSSYVTTPPLAAHSYTYTTARQSPQDLDLRAMSTSSKQGDTSRTTAGSQAQLILLPCCRRYQDLSCLPCLRYARSRARPGHVQRSSTPLPLCYSRAAPLVCVESLAAFCSSLPQEASNDE